MDLVLNEIIHKRHQSAKKRSRKYLPVLDSFGVVGAECKAT